VIFLHLSIGETRSRQDDLFKNYYKTSSFIRRSLGAFAVEEATASIRRTRLAVVRRKSTNIRVTHKWDNGQLTREERYPSQVQSF
jgi:hypothetical protein